MKFISILSLSLVAITIFSCGGGGKTANGFEYIKHTNSTGAKPNPMDYAFVHIYAMHDDSVMQTTRKNGKTIPIVMPDAAAAKAQPDGKPNPITDVLSLMAVGDSATVIVPIDEDLLKQNPALSEVKQLAYVVVLEEIKTQAAFDAERTAKLQEAQAAKKAAAGNIAPLMDGIIQQYGAGELKDKLKTTASGLKYIVLEDGKGAQAVAGKTVDVQYYGALTNGSLFDTSFGRNQPFSFPLGAGRVIKGWDEGIALLKVGAKAVLFVPAELGYGAADKGTIPPNSELIFYVELQGVK